MPKNFDPVKKLKLTKSTSKLPTLQSFCHVKIQKNETKLVKIGWAILETDKSNKSFPK